MSWLIYNWRSWSLKFSLDLRLSPQSKHAARTYPKFIERSAQKSKFVEHVRTSPVARIRRTITGLLAPKKTAKSAMTQKCSLQKMFTHKFKHQHQHQASHCSINVLCLEISYQNRLHPSTQQPQPCTGQDLPQRLEKQFTDIFFCWHRWDRSY